MNDKGDREVVIDGETVLFWVTAAMAFGGTASGRKRSLYARRSGQPKQRGCRLHSPADHDTAWGYSDEHLVSLWRGRLDD